MILRLALWLFYHATRGDVVAEAEALKVANASW